MPSDRESRRPHLSPALLVVVAAGGAVGTAAREGLALTIPDVGGFPVAVFGINVVGAFVLGVLLESLLRSGADTGGRRVVRLLAGTGFCGGFTTYSALATTAAVFLAQGPAAAGVAYGVATVLAGVLATWVGIAAGTVLTGRRRA